MRGCRLRLPDEGVQVDQFPKLFSKLELHRQTCSLLYLRDQLVFLNPRQVQLIWYSVLNTCMLTRQIYIFDWVLIKV